MVEKGGVPAAFENPAGHDEEVSVGMEGEDFHEAFADFTLGVPIGEKRRSHKGYLLEGFAFFPGADLDGHFLFQVSQKAQEFVG